MDFKEKINVPAFRRDFGDSFEGVFGGANECAVTRREVFEEFRAGRTLLGLQKTFCWGFPQGDQRLADTFRRGFIGNINAYVDAVEELKAGKGNWSDVIALVRRPHVSNGIYTKILYFAEVHVQIKGRGNPKPVACCILDEKIRRQINRGCWDEFESLKELPGKYKVTPEIYGDYCTILRNVSHKIKCRTDQVEYWLFLSESDKFRGYSSQNEASHH